jgi:hypothetical protein
MLVACSVGFAVGNARGEAHAPREPQYTELTAGRTLAGKNVRLIGFDCGPTHDVVLMEEEDMGGSPCKSIEELDPEHL